jgi:dihydroorotate dehydrogenase subfamily 1
VKNETTPIYENAKVLSCAEVQGAKPTGSVFCLQLKVSAYESSLPRPGQFYMLHAQKGKALLGRPISVYKVEKVAQFNESIPKFLVIISFLILKKGKGTEDLCTLSENDIVEILGPQGNTFPEPKPNTKVCIVGGGIGVAPVANFAQSIPDSSYDFFASFKSGSYALDYVSKTNLTITTDDGSVGLHGMLPTALTKELLEEKKYSAVYACGPTPMLSYVQKICMESNIPCYISMEARMACGAGACLGCTVRTTEGNKRCCKDGPVFDGSILDFSKPEIKPSSKEAGTLVSSENIKSSLSDLKIGTPHYPILVKDTDASFEPDLSVTLSDVTLKNPLIGASGTFGYGSEYQPFFDVSSLGGIASKGLTLEPREGNTGIRVWETASGLMNSIGLQNPGIPHFIENELPTMLKFDTVTFANLSGSSLETYVEGAKLLDKTQVPIIELNISCPNVKAGGAAFGMTCNTAKEVTSAIRSVTSKPLIVKLTPQAPDITSVALACIEAGANGISLCNSFQGVAIDITKGRPVFDNVKAGYGGPAVKPIALRLVYEMVQAINKLPQEKRVPVIGIGGITTWQDAVEFIMAGASALEVGSATFINPLSMINIIDGLKSYMKQNGFRNLSEMRSIAQ